MRWPGSENRPTHNMSPCILISGVSVLNFDTMKGVSTSSGFINGFGSLGQTNGVTLPV